jgi:ATP-binding cassette, subfamily B, bacterial
MTWQKHPVTRVLELVRQEKSLIYSIYFFAILTGLIQLTLPVGIQTIINFVLAGSYSMSLVILITLVVAGVFTSGMLQVSQMKIIETIQQNIFVRYAYAFAERIPRIDLKKADNYYLPELVNRFFEIPNLQKGLAKLLLDIPVAFIQILFGLMLLSFYHPAFIFFGLVLILLLWLTIRFTGNKGLQTSFEASAYKYQVAAWLEELARVVKTFKFSKGSAIHLEKADEKTSNYLRAKTQHFSILLFQYKIMVVFKTLITASMLIVGSILLLNQQLNIGQFIAAEIVILTIIAAIEKVIVSLDNIYQIMTSVDKIAKVTEKPIEVHGTREINPLQSIAISFRNVSFGYQEGQSVLNEITFEINAGDKVIIQGKEGAGKTSLLKLMTGSYLDFDGSILVNNIPIGNYDISSLRNSTGTFLNLQDIFQGTLLENISMGNNDVDVEEIITLSHQVGLYDFIAGLKEGLNTELETSGKRLPATVVHKILLVRALVKSPRLILMEEPFATLEEPYRSNLRNLLEQMPSTVVVVSNDVLFAKHCNKTIYLG